MKRSSTVLVLASAICFAGMASAPLLVPMANADESRRTFVSFLSSCTGCCLGELKVQKEEVEKHCWDTEKKQICVPRIVFPWQRSHCTKRAETGALRSVRDAPKMQP